MIKKIYVLLIFVALFSLTGCINEYKKEDKAIKEEAIELAKQYYKDKYNEDFEPTNYKTYIYREDTSGTPIPVFGKPYKKVDFYNDNESIFVNIEDNSIADTKQLNEIKNDLKEYIQDEYFTKNGIDLENTIIDRDFIHSDTFQVYSLNPEDKGFYIDYNNDYRLEGYLDKETIYSGDIKEFIENNNLGIKIKVHFKANEELSDDIIAEYEEKFLKALNDIQKDFNGDDSQISFMLYKPDKYMNQDVKDIFEEQKTSVSTSHSYIYGPDYVYLKVVSEKVSESNEWETTITNDKETN